MGIGRLSREDLWDCDSETYNRECYGPVSDYTEHDRVRLYIGYGVGTINSIGLLLGYSNRKTRRIANDLMRQGIVEYQSGRYQLKDVLL